MAAYDLSLFGHLRNLVNYHELFSSLVYRAVHSRYRQSALGLAWAILKPLATVLIFTVVFSYIAKFPSEGIPYPLFAFGALLPWTFFTTAVNSAVPSLVNNAGLVTKIYFPREIIPLSTIAGAFIDFFISCIIMVVMLFYYDVGITWNILYIIPVLMIEIVFSSGLVLLCSVVNVWFRDVTQALGLLTQLWMYLTPIVYPITMVPDKYRLIYAVNPMVGIVEAFRAAILKGNQPDMVMLDFSVVMALIFFIVGYRVFKAFEFSFADVI